MPSRSDPIPRELRDEIVELHYRQFSAMQIASLTRAAYTRIEDVLAAEAREATWRTPS